MTVHSHPHPSRGSHGGESHTHSHEHPDGFRHDGPLSHDHHDDEATTLAASFGAGSTSTRARPTKATTARRRLVVPDYTTKARLELEKERAR